MSITEVFLYFYSDLSSLVFHIIVFFKFRGTFFWAEMLTPPNHNVDLYVGDHGDMCGCAAMKARG